MNDEQQLLASVYLDDALTDEERARAEADPDVMAAIEQLRELRRALSAVDPPDRARRDAAINAALAAFDAERRPTAPPPVSSLASRRASRWFIGAAAAAIVLVIAGGIVATRGGSDDGGGGAASGDDAGAAVTEAAGGGVAEAPGSSAAAAEADTRAAQDTAGGASETTAGAAAGTAAPAATTLSNLGVPLTAREFLQYASSLAPAPAADESTPRCHGGQFLGRHVLPIDGKDTTVEIFYNRRAREYIALNARTCEPLISATAP